jgi:hypothetical protein
MQTINNEQNNSGINTIFMALLPKRNEHLLRRIPRFLASPLQQEQQFWEISPLFHDVNSSYPVFFA